MLDIPLANGLATKSLELVKALRDIDKQLGEAELKAKAAELLSNLADVKIAFVEAGDELRQRDAKIAQLKTAFQLKDECVRQHDFLYTKRPDGTPTGGRPYCPRCEQIDGMMMKLMKDTGERGDAICPQCKTKYRHVPFYE